MRTPKSYILLLGRGPPKMAAHVERGRCFPFGVTAFLVSVEKRFVMAGNDDVVTAGRGFFVFRAR